MLDNSSNKPKIKKDTIQLTEMISLLEALTIDHKAPSEKPTYNFKRCGAMFE